MSDNRDLKIGDEIDTLEFGVCRVVDIYISPTTNNYTFKVESEGSFYVTEELTPP